MFYGDTIQDTRQFFYTTWKKFQQNQPLTALENTIAEVIKAHPEYHIVLNNPERYQEKDYYPQSQEANPFLHMGLHIALREQVSTNRPEGITELYAKFVKKYSDPWNAEHLMMELLAESLWLAQRDNQYPNEQNYLDSLKKLL